jgi:riboflavin transporter
MPEFQVFLLGDYMKKNSIRKLTVIGVLSSVSAVLMFLEIPLGFLPEFYKLDLSEIPILIAAFAYGPVVGIIIELIKNLIHIVIKGTSTMGVGELANFLIGISLVVPASLIYFKKKTRKHAIIGLIIGALSMAAAGALLNAFVLLPIYAYVFNSTVADWVHLGTLANPLVNESLFNFMLFSVVPFNLIKAILSGAIVILIYKRVSHIIKAKDSEQHD